MRSLRGLGVALAILTLTAGAALASHPLPDAAANGLGHAPGLEVAADAAGKTIPPGWQAELVMPTDEEEAQEPTEEETEEPAEDEEAAEDTHGATVSEAAKGDTPDGWRNHGAYVSAVARGLVDVGAEAPQEAKDNGGRMPKPEKTPKP
jgi:hypothetical protein